MSSVTTCPSCSGSFAFVSGEKSDRDCISFFCSSLQPTKRGERSLWSLHLGKTLQLLILFFNSCFKVKEGSLECFLYAGN